MFVGKMSDSRAALYAGCVGYLVVTISLYGVARAPAGLRGELYIATHLLLAAFMVLVWFVGRRKPARSARVVLVTGVIARLALFGVPLFTSHDVQRYLWDGFTAIHGLDPYRVAPLEVPREIAARWGALPDNANWTTLYPPGALALYSLCALTGLSRGWLIWKAVILAGSLGLVGLVYRALREENQFEYFPFVALSPLLVLEGGVGAHLDMLAALCLVAGLWLAPRKPGYAGWWLGVGGTLKFIPLVALPFLWLRAEGLARRRLAVGCAAGLGLGYVGALFFHLVPVGSLFGFFRVWSFGSPLAGLFSALPPPLSWGVRSLIFLLGIGFLARNARRLPVVEAVLWTLSLVFLVTNVIFPWYLVPMAALTAFYPSWLLIIWTLSLPMTYEVLDRYDLVGKWNPAVWPMWVIAAGWFLVLAGRVWFSRPRHGGRWRWRWPRLFLWGRRQPG